MERASHERTISGRLSGKIAMIVGAGSSGPGWGIGKATAALFAREGAKVLVVDRDPGAAAETRRVIEEAGGTSLDHVADATDAEAMRAAVAACVAGFGGIDVLVNNVGIVEIGGPVEASEEGWDRVMAANVKSAFLACKLAIPRMLERGGGAIVNVSSIAALRWGGVAYVSYAASKSALNQLSQVVALEYAAMGIRSNCVVPGLMNTPLIYKNLIGRYGDGDVETMVAARDRQVPMGRMGDAWDVAYAALFLASDEARFVTGTNLVVDGGMTCTMVAARDI